MRKRTNIVCVNCYVGNTTKEYRNGSFQQFSARIGKGKLKPFFEWVGDSRKR